MTGSRNSRIALTLNGAAVETEVEPQELLIDFLRDGMGLRGTKRSCDVQVCGACTVLRDGEPISACCTLATDVDGCDVLTIEGFAASPEFGSVEAAFVRHSALQCGFCTPAMVLAAKALLDVGEARTEEEVRHGLAGNLCRCTGYRRIVDAVLELADAWPA